MWKFEVGLDPETPVLVGEPFLVPVAEADEEVLGEWCAFVGWPGEPAGLDMQNGLLLLLATKDLRVASDLPRPLNAMRRSRTRPAL
jgi:hypothetical protein